MILLTNTCKGYLFLPLALILLFGSTLVIYQQSFGSFQHRDSVLEYVRTELPRVETPGLESAFIGWAKRKYQKRLVKLRTGEAVQRITSSQKTLGKALQLSERAPNCPREESAELRAIAERLLPHFNERDASRLPALTEWKFYEVEDCNTYAHVTPAGEIYFQKDFLDSLKSEAEVAGVLAHEIAHLYLLHWGLLAEGLNSGSVLKAIMSVAGDAFISDYYEAEADWMAVMVTGKAGYSPVGLANALSRLPENTSGEQVDGLESLFELIFRTHPATQQRLGMIRDAVEEFYLDPNSSMWRPGNQAPRDYYYVGSRPWNGRPSALIEWYGRSMERLTLPR